MEIKIAKTAGFCFGVSRAVSKTMEEAEKADPVFTFGPIVHNASVTEELEKRGVSVISGLSELAEERKGTLIIRAHGIPEDTEKCLRASGMNVIDATCPFVKKIHMTVQKAGNEGKTVVVFGDSLHPEVRGIIGNGRGPVYVADSFESFLSLNLPKEEPLVIVAQTTFYRKNFDFIVEKIKSLEYNANIVNTICNATEERQNEATELSENTEVMLVIGSPDSSNSRKLYDICRKKCNRTYFIQTVRDLSADWFRDVKSVGITAGASTPNKIIEEVQKHVRKF